MEVPEPLPASWGLLHPVVLSEGDESWHQYLYRTQVSSFHQLEQSILYPCAICFLFPSWDKSACVRNLNHFVLNSSVVTMIGWKVLPLEAFIYQIRSFGSNQVNSVDRILTLQFSSRQSDVATIVSELFSGRNFTSLTILQQMVNSFRETHPSLVEFNNVIFDVFINCQSDASMWN